MALPPDALGPDPEDRGVRTGPVRTGPLASPIPDAMRAFRAGRALRVLVAGGGVAALEAVLALQAEAGRLTDVTLVTAEDEFVERAASVAEPFGSAPARRRLVTEVVGTAAEVVLDEVVRVDRGARRVRTRGGRDLGYDVLVIATGARMRRPYADALTFPLDPPSAVADLLRDVEEGYDQGVAVVVPPGPTWMLPAYEIALQTAHETRRLGKTPRVVLVTPEGRPLDHFGRPAGEAARRLLDEAGVELRLRCTAVQDDRGELVLAPTGERLTGLRVVALPVLEGQAPEGVPVVADGFVGVDDLGRVASTPGLYAIGDAAAWPVKHGSLAVQQALVTARHIAQLAGADVVARPWEPMLEATLWGGRVDLHLQAAPSLAADASGLAAPAAGRHRKLAAHRLDQALDRTGR